MADNVVLDPGAGGETVATDQLAGGEHVQYVKLMDGTADSSAKVPGSATDGLLVNLGANNDVTVTGTATVTGNVAHDGAASGNPVQIAGLGSAAAPTDVSADGDVTRIWTTLKGAVNIADAGGNISIDDGGNSITVDGSVTANAGTNLNTSALALESGGNLATIAALSKAEDSAHASGNTGVMLLAVRQATATDLSAGNTDGDYEPLEVDANGRLHVNAGTVTVASHAVTNAGTFAVQVDGNALTSLQLIDDPVIADDAAFTPATSKVMMAGFEADESSTDSVDEGDAGAARMTLDRKQIVTPQPHTAGGLSTFMASGSDGSSILVATAQAVKASAGQLYGYYLYNPEAAVSFVHFYNTAAASVTVGTTNPLFTLAVPAGSAANLMFTHGVTFSNAGWSISATTTAGGNTSPSTGVSAVIWYV